MDKTVIVWFRQDLRLSDNPAFFEACKISKNIIPVYILDDYSPGKWKLGGASRWWLHHSLLSLSEKLRRMGTNLVLAKGNSSEILSEIARKSNSSHIFWNRCYEPYSIKRDEKIKKLLGESGIIAKSFNGSLLFEPWEIKNKQGSYFKVYTAFWKSCLAESSVNPPLPEPKLKLNGSKLFFLDIEELNLLPKTPDWSSGLKELWQPGEEGAKKQLSNFLDGPLDKYTAGRDIPGISGTSRLSPHIHFGEISPRQVWSSAIFTKNLTRNSAYSSNIDKFLSEIGWREFSHSLLYNFPMLPDSPFDSRFDKFEWKHDGALFKKWQKGKTGYPIVDAGMRELWKTGWMHNRVRMIVASFLTKHLLIPWQKGAEWFWDTLVDADLANNSAGWQWVAGSGADAAPYFRIFNPVLQGERFDRDGSYVRIWVPEIAGLPDKFLHKPWKTPDDIQKNLGIIIGKDYPLPIVDHETARSLAMEKYKKLRS